MICRYIEGDGREMYMGHNSRYRVTPGHVVSIHTVTSDDVSTSWFAVILKGKGVKWTGQTTLGTE